MKAIMIIVLIFLLIGCAGTYYKSGISQQQRQEDIFNCEMKCTPYASSYGRGINPFMLNDCMGRCLKSMGYTAK